MEMIQLLRQIEANTRPQKVFSITVTSPPGLTTDSFRKVFEDPIRADEGRRLEMALIGFQTSYSWTNVNSQNNTFVYSSDKGGSFKTIVLPEGAYELEAINSEIQRQIGADTLSISPNLATLRAIIEVFNPDFQVDVGKSTLNTLLGWPKDFGILKQGRHEAPNIVRISNVNEILIHCNVIDGSYTATSSGRGQITQSYVLSSFFPDVAPGYKINYKPFHRVFLPLIANHIQQMHIWVTDQDNNPIDMRGEPITVNLQIRDNPV